MFVSISISHILFLNILRYVVFILWNNKYMLFAGWEVRMVKNSDRGLINAVFSRSRSQFFTIWFFTNLVFPLQKLNSNDTLQQDSRGFNAAFSQWVSSVSVVQWTVHVSNLNGRGKTPRERILVVELKLELCSLFHSEKIVWENSNISWMKVPPISSTVTKYLTF